MSDPSVRAVLFDKDGTLLDFCRSWAPISRACAVSAAGGPGPLADRLLHACGHDPQTDQFRPGSPMVAGTAADIAAAWLPLLPSGSVVLGQLTARIDQTFTAQAATAPVAVDGLAGVLGRLRDCGLPLGVATSDNEASARVTLEAFGVDQHFAFVCGYDSGHGRKPGPGMVLAFCRAVGVAPAETLVVGDSVHDLEMAQAAGARAVGVLTGPATEADLEPHAEVVLPSVAALPAWLGLGR